MAFHACEVLGERGERKNWLEELNSNEREMRIVQGRSNVRREEERKRIRALQPSSYPGGISTYLLLQPFVSLADGNVRVHSLTYTPYETCITKKYHKI